MARLNSDMTLKFVALKLGVLDTVVEKINGFGTSYNSSTAKSEIRLIDPCAGEGVALAALRGRLEAKMKQNVVRHSRSDVVSYGIEIERERAKRALRILDNFMEADYFSAVISKKRFSLALLNPPYDIDPEYKRLEYRFLVSVTELLRDAGLLVLVVPRYTLRIMAEFLIQNYQNFSIWDEGNEHSEAFGQVILMATRSNYATNKADMKRQILAFANGKIDSVEPDRTYSIEALFAKVERFSKVLIDYETAFSEMGALGIEKTRRWRDMTVPPENTHINPLVPLRTGHLLQILASGVAGDYGIPLYNPLEGLARLFRAMSNKGVDVEVVGDDHNQRKVVSERMMHTASYLDLESYEYEDDVNLGEFIQEWREPLAVYVQDNMPAVFHPSKVQRPDYSKYLRPPMPGNGQRIVIEAAAFALREGFPTVVLVGEMGCGKTFCSIVAANEAGMRRVVVLCPPTLVWKWKEELEKTLPGVRAFVVGGEARGEAAHHPFYRMWQNPMGQLRWIHRAYGKGQHPDVPVYVVMAHSKAKASYGRIPAVLWRWGYRPQSYFEQFTGDLIHPKWRPFREIVEEDEYDANNVEVVPDEVEDDEDPEDRQEVEEVGVEEAEVEAEVDVEVEVAPIILPPVVQRMCCPDCWMPITDKNGLFMTWEWLTKRRRTCINKVIVGRTEKTDNSGSKVYETETRPCGAELWQGLCSNYMGGDVNAGFRKKEQLKDRCRRQALYAYDARGEDARVLYGGRGRLSLNYRSSVAAEIAVGMMPIYRSKALPPRRFDLAEFIKREFPDDFQLLIPDEVHQYKSSDSVQAMTASILSEVIPQKLSLTGTMMAGYARDLFRLLYHFGGREVRDDFEHNEENRWSKLYGLVQKIVRLDGADSMRSRNKGNRTRSKDLPGVMPGVLRYILVNSLFIRLMDVARGLPSFNEYNITVDLDERRQGVANDIVPDVDDDEDAVGMSQREAYKELETSMLREIKALTYSNPKAAQQLVSIFSHAVLSYPDCCTQEKAGRIKHPLGGLFIDLPPLASDWTYPKEDKLVEICKSERDEGRASLVYVTHTALRDVIPRLESVLTQSGLRVKVLRADTVHSSRRIEWVAEQFEHGLDVLICHPQLVETGVDLLQFPTIIWYECDYNTSRVRQASRRSWRIGQTQPVKVYYLTYADSKQTQALYLIARKVATSLAIEGDLSDEGLAALSGGDEMSKSIRELLVESGFDFGQTFESKLNIAGIDVESETEELLVSDVDDWALEDVDYPEIERADGLTDDLVAGLLSPELDDIFDAAMPNVEVTDEPQAPLDLSGRSGPGVMPQKSVLLPKPLVDPAAEVQEFGAVSLDAWVSTFGLQMEDLQRGKRKRTRRKKGDAKDEVTQLGLH